uniref:Uncharacterized protein n=1 Tax=Rhizophora mucronata TaxID=61149 RepID=A0A2P2NV95_RHIMU
MKQVRTAMIDYRASFLRVCS